LEGLGKTGGGRKLARIFLHWLIDWFGTYVRFLEVYCPNTGLRRRDYSFPCEDVFSVLELSIWFCRIFHESTWRHIVVALLDVVLLYLELHCASARWDGSCSFVGRFALAHWNGSPAICWLKRWQDNTFPT
jgi:hypothetical protein